jgi:ABC-type iron transport system FetAB ATPase subunit
VCICPQLDPQMIRGRNTDLRRERPLVKRVAYDRPMLDREVSDLTFNVDTLMLRQRWVHNSLEQVSSARSEVAVQESAPELWEATITNNMLFPSAVPLVTNSLRRTKSHLSSMPFRMNCIHRVSNRHSSVESS